VVKVKLRAAFCGAVRVDFLIFYCRLLLARFLNASHSRHRGLSMSEEKNELGPVRKGLLSRRTVVLEGVIDEESIALVQNQLLQLQMVSDDRINLIIDSGGGDTYRALALCDLMTCVLTAPVRGIVNNVCGSAATFILLHCGERLGMPHAQFMIHSGQMGDIKIPVNQSTAKNLTQLLNEAKTTEEQVVRMYMDRLKKNRKQVQKLIARGDQSFDNLMTAEEALKVGLITHIVREKLDIFGPKS